MDVADIVADAEIVAQVRLGNHRAFHILFMRYAQALVSFVMRYVDSLDTAQDIVQDVFAHLWRTRELLDIRGSVRAYVYRAARNRALRLLEHEQYGEGWQAEQVAGWEGVAPAAANEGAAYLAYADLASAVTQALANVPPRAREIFLLSREEGLAPREIAELLEIGTPTVYNQLSRVLRHLAEQLQDWRPSSDM